MVYLHSARVLQLDGLVTGAGHDLTVVSAEGNRQDVLGMVLEAARGLASGQIPQAQSLVPGSGEGVVAVGREDDVADEVRVAVQTFLWDTIVGLVTGQFPYDQSLVARRRQDHIGVLRVGGDLRDPAIVAQEGTA